jgi:ATP-dependent RNA helicase DeaD
MNAQKETYRFGELSLSKPVGKAIADMGFEEPSPIQQRAIPLLLEGHDIIGQAQTGTGKTAAFGIPIVEKLKPRGPVQALVVTPTRELAIQVAEEISSIGKYMRIRTLPIYGGQPIDRQIRMLQKGVHVVIGTPGRLLDHLRRGTLRLNSIQVLVLDEADEMLDMGFIDDVETILRATPPDRQTLLFSATMPDEVARLARKYLNNPQFVTVSKNNLTVPTIEQVYYETTERNKLDSLCRLLDTGEINLAIIFCRTKRGVDELTAGLEARGYPAAGLHGDMSQHQRNSVMRQFKNGQAELLVATDVAARGLDIDNLSHVVNYDLPQDVEFYVHRIGRTGRAGKTGVAVSLITHRDYKQLRLIESMTNIKIRRCPLPSVAEVTRRQQEGIRERLVRIIEENKLEQYMDIIRPLLKENEPVNIAAAALRLAYDLDPMDSQEADAGEDGRGGTVRLFITLGRKDNITPGDMVRILAEESGMAGNLVGRINIYDKFSFVEVPREWSSCVIGYLHQSTVKGRRISVELARGRQ